MASSLAAAAAWLILPLQNRYWLFYERKKERKRKQINKRSAAISTRLIERQWVPSMCVDIYGAIRNIWKAVFLEVGKNHHLLFLFIVTITLLLLLLLLLLFFPHHHSTPHRSFACYGLLHTQQALKLSWAELRLFCFALGVRQIKCRSSFLSVFSGDSIGVCGCVFVCVFVW